LGLAIAGVVGFLVWLGAIDAGVVRRAGRTTPPRQRISEVTLPLSTPVVRDKTSATAGTISPEEPVTFFV